MRESISRGVLTCNPGFDASAPYESLCTTLISFEPNEPLITEALLDANDPTDRANIINWGIGLDVDSEDGAYNALKVMRPSLHGDVVHSRPVALDYGTDPNNPQVAVFYSGNDGILRSVNGNRTSAIGTVGAGEELWAFMPPEFYPYLKVLRENDAVIKFPASGPSSIGKSGIAKPYGIEGPLTAFEGTITAYNDVKKYLYATMRRSGRSVYAFDVSSAVSPTLLWKKGCPSFANDTGCSADSFASPTPWASIGQTWSAANIAFTTAYNGPYTLADSSLITKMKPMLIMGGGYDGCEDFDGDADSDGSLENHDCISTDKGGIIYILDAQDGSVLQTFPTDRAVSGNVTVVPLSDTDPRIIYAYATDLGGNIYRISADNAGTPAPISSELPSAWIITKIAALGCGTPSTDAASCDANRKFMHGPDVVKIPSSDKLAVLVGSGDREKPLRDYSAALGVQNYFFSVIDQPTLTTWFDDAETTCPTTNTLPTTNTICLKALDAVSLAGGTPSAYGFHLPLAVDEQVVTAALTVADVANFSTHIPVDPNGPDAEACASNLGIATTYNINYQDAEGGVVDILGGGLVPTPVAGKVILDDGSIVPFCIGCGGEQSAIGGSVVGSGINWIQPKSRVYWNIQK